MRLAMQRSKSLKNSEEKVKEMRDTRVLKEVMSTLNNMKEVKQMRERALDGLIEKMQYRVLAQTLYTIRSHAYKRTLNAQADHQYQCRLRVSAFKAIHSYQVRKAKEDNDFRLARKFRHVSQLSMGLRAFKSYRIWVQRQAQLEKATQSFRKRWLVKRAWTLFSGLDEVLAEKLKIIRDRAKHYAF